MPGQGVEDRRGGHTATPVVRGPARLPRTPYGPPSRHIALLVFRLGLAQALEQCGEGELKVPDHPGGDGVETFHQRPSSARGPSSADPLTRSGGQVLPGRRVRGVQRLASLIPQVGQDLFGERTLAGL